MNREILFRGFPEGNIFDEKKWNYGDLVHDSFDGRCNVLVGIRMQGCYPVGVNPDSVGQFIGLTNKHGSKIFEGDIVKWGKYPAVCVFGKNGWMFENHLGDFTANGYASECEIIGNVFENHELMDVENE